MSAELLRRAAALMYERAQAAAEWNADVVSGDSLHLWVTCYDPSDPSGQTAMQRVVGGADAPWAEHIASWHPAVALAVADLLDLAAEHQKREGDDCGQGYGPDGYGDIDPSCSVCGTPDEYAEPWPCAYAQKGLAVARAYLGEEL